MIPLISTRDLFSFASTSSPVFTSGLSAPIEFYAFAQDEHSKASRK
jgi:hypothetical protein